MPSEQTTTTTTVVPEDTTTTTTVEPEETTTTTTVVSEDKVQSKPRGEVHTDEEAKRQAPDADADAQARSDNIENAKVEGLRNHQASVDENSQN